MYQLFKILNRNLQLQKENGYEIGTKRIVIYQTNGQKIMKAASMLDNNMVHTSILKITDCISFVFL